MSIGCVVLHIKFPKIYLGMALINVLKDSREPWRLDSVAALGSHSSFSGQRKALKSLATGHEQHSFLAKNY